MSFRQDVYINGLEEAANRFYSKYRANVINNEDPNGLGRILVMVPSLNSPPLLAEPSSPIYGTVLSGHRGQIPRPGEVVWVSFEGGDTAKPIWDYHTWGLEEVPEEFLDPETSGTITHNGNKILIFDKGNRILISITNDNKEESASYIEMSPEAIKIKSEKEVILMEGEYNEGIPISSKLVDKLNKIENAYIDLVSSLKGFIFPSTKEELPVASTNWSQRVNSLTSLNTTEIKDIENKNIIQ